MDFERSLSMAHEYKRRTDDYYVFAKPGKRDLSRPGRFAVTVNPRAAEASEGTDVHALTVERCISVTPLAATFRCAAALDELLDALVLGCAGPEQSTHPAPGI